MPLPQFGVIDVAGDDAATFLHSQLTNDIEHLDAASARLSGYCSPKGRLLGSFLTWRAGHGVRLLVSKDVQPAVQKRLSMFVLRAKAKLTDASDALAVVGFAGDVRDALSGIFDALPDGVHVKVDVACRHTDPRARCSRSQALSVDRPARRSRRAHRRARRVAAGRVAGRLGLARHPRGRTAHHAAGRRTVRAADGQLRRDRRRQLSQRVLPGQEIVARSQYRGTIKRRTALAHVAGETDTVHAGVELFHSDDPGQPCGMIVNAAAAPAGGVDALVEIKLAALDSGTVHLGSADGPVLAFDTLPYAWPTEA